MATDVDICNLALGMVGDEANLQSIVPGVDQSAQADHCARFYPIARRAQLAAHAWQFSTKRIVLSDQSLGVNDVQPPAWAYAYALPSNFLSLFSVLPPNDSSPLITPYATQYLDTPRDWPKDTDGQEYITETLQDGTSVLYTNVYQPTLRYSVDVTDTGKFPALFVTALARLLASYLAGPILKGEEGRAEAKAHHDTWLKVDFPMACAGSAKMRRMETYDRFTPQSIRARQ